MLTLLLDLLEGVGMLDKLAALLRGEQVKDFWNPLSRKRLWGPPASATTAAASNASSRQGPELLSTIQLLMDNVVVLVSPPPPVPAAPRSMLLCVRSVLRRVRKGSLESS